MNDADRLERMASGDGTPWIFFPDDRAALRRAAAILRRQATTRDGVTVLDGDTVYKGPCSADEPYEQGQELTMNMVGGYEGDVVPGDCYSTREAAEAAREVTE